MGEGATSLLTLDHLALVTADLEKSREQYQALGFQLTPLSSHKGRLTEDGPIELWGTGNHCAMFHQGYLEILGVTDPTRHLGRFGHRLARYHGLQLIALGCEDAFALHEELSAVVEGLREVSEVGRDVPYGEGTKPGLFRILQLEQGRFPEADLFFIEQATPEVLWQPDLLDHPNGVEALVGCTICCEFPEETAHRFERITLRERAATSDVQFQLGEGFLGIATKNDIERRYPGAVLPAVPSVAVATFRVHRLKETADYLEAEGITAHQNDDRLWLRPERAGGAVLEFVE